MRLGVETQDFDESDQGAVVVPEQRWSEFDASFDSTGFATSEGGGANVEVMTLAATTQGYVAAGTFEGRLAVWRSDDLEVFDAVYDDACCDRWVRPEAIVEVAGTLLISGSGEVRTGDAPVERNFLLLSDDGGTTWRTSEHPAFETVSPEWPSREVEWEDGPQWLVYGTIERPFDDVLDVAIDELGTVATFRPVPEADPEIFCS